MKIDLPATRRFMPTARLLDLPASMQSAAKPGLLGFCEYAERWIHRRTSNPIESMFSPVRARTEVTKGPGSREAGLAMCLKLIEVAEGRWRRLNATKLVALVRAGVKFVNGRLVERTDREDAA